MSVRAGDGVSTSRVVFVGQRIENHSPHSGYDKLIDHFPDSTTIAPLSWWPARVAVLQAYRRLLERRRPNAWYSGRDALREAAVALARTRRERTIFHFFYAESSLWLTSSLRLGRRHRIVASFHNPPELFRPIAKRRLFMGLDAVIALGRRQRAFFADLIGDERAHFIPYAVDTDYFAPGVSTESRAEGPLHLLFVGHYLRDFDTLQAVVRALVSGLSPLRARPEITLVTEPARVSGVAGLPGVRVVTGIPEDDLRALYREADVLLLPLANCVANTAVLEALACGTPVVTSDVGDAADYVTSDCGRLVPAGDVDAFVDTLWNLSCDREKLLCMRRNARARAESFSWDSVTTRVRALYDGLVR